MSVRSMPGHAVLVRRPARLRWVVALSCAGAAALAVAAPTQATPTLAARTAPQVLSSPVVAQAAAGPGSAAASRASASEPTRDPAAVPPAGRPTSAARRGLVDGVGGGNVDPAGPSLRGATRRSLTQEQTADAALAADGLVPMVPVRILDTSRNLGITGAFWAGRTAKLQVGGRGGVPARGVRAVMLSVTALAPTANGYLSVYSTSQRRTTSSVNLERGVPVTTATIAEVSTDGAVAVYNAAGTVTVQADVTGWFGTTGPYTPVAPRRLLDTRSGLGAAKGAVGAGGTRTVTVTGVPGLPAGTASVALALVAVTPGAGGYLTAYPTGAARPNASTLTYRKGHSTANLTVTKVGTAGRVSVYVAGTTHVLLDVVGGFDADGTYHAVDPARMFDSRRDTKGSDGKPYPMPSGDDYLWDFVVTGFNGIPQTGVAAVMVNLTVASPTANSRLTTWPTRAGALGATRPNATAVTFTSGVTRTGSTLVRVGSDGMIRIYNAAGYAHVILDVVGYVTTTGTPDRTAVGRPTLPMRTWDGKLLSDAEVAPLAVSDDGRWTLVLDIARKTLPYMGGNQATVIRDNLLGINRAVNSQYATVRGMSGDGRWILWTSGEKYFASDANNAEDVYVSDLASGDYWILSTALDEHGFRIGDRASFSPSISRSGRYVAYVSDSTNLDAEHPSTTVARRVYLDDLDDLGEARHVPTVVGVTRAVGVPGVDDEGTVVWTETDTDDVIATEGPVHVWSGGADHTTQEVGRLFDTDPPSVSSAAGLALVRDVGIPFAPRLLDLDSGIAAPAFASRNDLRSYRISGSRLAADGSAVLATVHDPDNVLTATGSHVSQWQLLRRALPAGEVTDVVTSADGSPLAVGLHNPAMISPAGTWALFATRDPDVSSNPNGVVAIAPIG